jgi:hypothetical protein
MRRAVAIGAAGLALIALYVLTFGLFPRYFVMGWDEDVRLRDGRTIAVHIDRTFERSGLRLARWEGTYRDTEISFDAGEPLGKVKKRFDRYQVNMIETANGRWYIGLSDTSGSPPMRIVSEQIPVLILLPDRSEVAARSWDDVPDFPQQNVMPLTPSVEVARQFQGQHLAWEQKMAHWRQFPRAAGDNGKIIQRHTRNAN